jgi:tight adherence protein C
MDPAMNAATWAPWAAFAGLACAAWVVLDYLWSHKDERTFDRLKKLQRLKRAAARSKLDPDSKVATILKHSSERLSKVLQPKKALEQQKLKLALAHAGFHTPAAPTLYLASKAACMIAGFLLPGTISLLLWGASSKSLATTVVCVAMGCLTPRIVLQYLQNRRQRQIFKSLPDALDLLVICVETGLGIDAALYRVGRELARRAPELCEEFSLYELQTQMGRPRRDALHDLGVRTGVEDLNSLATVLIQADRFGNSIAATLRDLSDMMRVKRRQFAEERAQKTAVKLIFPLVLFIFPGIFTILVGPAAILMMRDMLAMR